VRVYRGADADFTLYDDDGTTYAYEKGTGTTVTRLHWDDAAGKLRGVEARLVDVIGR